VKLQQNLDAKMTEALTHVRDKLFCPVTNLTYDNISSLDPEHRFDHLPYPEEIARQFPNPAGWGTSMEDSMLNAGSLMEVLCLRYELEHDNDALAWAEKVLAGMELCATVHGVPGFVARSVSPRDGKSCYINSSRDQFTLCVYGAWRLWKTAAQRDPELKDRAASLLVSIARYCERVIVDEGHKDLRRIDGQPGLVSSVLDTEAHEIMRLPMFFAAAWAVTDDPHWFNLYRRYALPGLEINQHFDPAHLWWDIEFVQMQLSLFLLADVEKDAALKNAYAELMNTSADMAVPYFDRELETALSFKGDWSPLINCWRSQKFVIRPDTLSGPNQSAIHDGYPNMMPQFPPEYRQPFRLLQGCGNYLVTLMLAPKYESFLGQAEKLSRVAVKPDYRRHASDGPINILHGYWLARGRGLFAP